MMEATGIWSKLSASELRRLVAVTLAVAIAGLAVVLYLGSGTSMFSISAAARIAARAPLALLLMFSLVFFRAGYLRSRVVSQGPKEGTPRLALDLLFGIAAVVIIELTAYGVSRLYQFSAERLLLGYQLSYVTAVIQITAMASKRSAESLRQLVPTMLSIAGLTAFSTGVALWV